MNPAAGCTAQRQSGTLIAALRTRVADQSSDACQYFRIIVEGCLLLISLSLSLPFSFSLPPFIPSIPFLLLHIRLLPSSFMSSPLLPRVCTQSQTSVAGKAKRRAGSGFFKATRRRFNATGIMRLDRNYGFCSRSARIRGGV